MSTSLPVLCTKVSDALGQALVVFHGTSARFDAFKENERGIFFAETRAFAEPYARIGRGQDPRIITAHLVVRNPWTMIRYADDFPFSRMMDQSITALRARGYDAIHNPQDKVWIVFDAKQIKVRQVQPMQQPKTQDKNLAAWFGQSQVVDGSGQPLKVFHGTSRSFDAFSKKGIAPNFKNAQKELGFYFANDADYALQYAMKGVTDQSESRPSLMPVYLRIENPKTLPMAFIDEVEDGVKGGAKKWSMQQGRDFVKSLRSQGHDGIIFEGKWTGWVDGQRVSRPINEYVVFEPENIKSAIGNCGSFDARNDDIRFSLAPPDDLNELDGDAGVDAGDVDDEIEPSFPAPC